MQVPRKAGPTFRWSKHPLKTCYIRRMCFNRNFSKFGEMAKFANKVHELV